VEVAAAAGRSRRITERRLVVRVSADAHLRAGWQTLIAGVGRVSWLTAGCWTAARAHTEHIGLVAGRELFADSLAILEHR